MMRIMLDTNILISYILFKNETMDLVFKYMLVKEQLVLSNVIISELKAVFDRKFPHKKYMLEEFLENIDLEIIEIEKINRGLFEIRDKKDYPILYSAIKGNIDIFISGDKDFYEVKIDKPKIMNMKEYIIKYIL